MKTLSGLCDSSKEITLSKATKILCKFVSADNGASQVINAYLHRASAAFNELNQFRRELKPSQSHRKNRRSHTRDDNGGVAENYSKSVDVKPENEYGRERERVHDENAKKEKKNKKKDKNLEGENAKEKEQQKEMEKKVSNNVKVENGKGREQQRKEVEKKLSSGVRSENGGLVGSWNIEIRSKLKHEAKLHVEEVKTEQRKKKRKNENVEDGYGEQSKKKMKRKHEG